MHGKEKVFKCAHDYQIENLVETNFVEIFGRAKQILSVQCVRTLIVEQKTIQLTDLLHASPRKLHFPSEFQGNVCRDFAIVRFAGFLKNKSFKGLIAVILHQKDPPGIIRGNIILQLCLRIHDVPSLLFAVILHSHLYSASRVSFDLPR